MIKNIVFDFGGVIVDIDRDKAVQAFIKLGLTDADSRLDKYHQTGIFQELEEVIVDILYKIIDPRIKLNWEIYADESLLWKKPNRHGWASSTK